ncbi:hypothetical protein HJFPF1_11611 [Paramyrothecium foliicola]|nr:hypothetical protein HJFPF1_11611 [Paramyrothecium foliicola]
MLRTRGQIRQALAELDANALPQVVIESQKYTTASPKDAEDEEEAQDPFETSSDDVSMIDNEGIDCTGRTTEIPVDITPYLPYGPIVLSTANTDRFSLRVTTLIRYMKYWADNLDLSHTAGEAPLSDMAMSASAIAYLRANDDVNITHTIIEAVPAQCQSLLGQEDIRLEDLLRLPVVDMTFAMWGVYIDIPTINNKPEGLYIGSSTKKQSASGIGARINEHIREGRKSFEQLNDNLARSPYYQLLTVYNATSNHRMLAFCRGEDSDIITDIEEKWIDFTENSICCACYSYFHASGKRKTPEQEQRTYYERLWQAGQLEDDTCGTCGAPRPENWRARVWLGFGPFAECDKCRYRRNNPIQPGDRDLGERGIDFRWGEHLEWVTQGNPDVCNDVINRGQTIGGRPGGKGFVKKPCAGHATSISICTVSTVRQEKNSLKTWRSTRRGWPPMLQGGINVQTSDYADRLRTSQFGYVPLSMSSSWIS